MPFPQILLKLDLWPWPQWASATALTLVMAHINFYLYNPHQASASYGIPIYKHWRYYQCWFWRRRSVWPGLKRNFLLPHTFCFMPLLTCWFHCTHFCHSTALCPAELSDTLSVLVWKSCHLLVRNMKNCFPVGWSLDTRAWLVKVSVGTWIASQLAK